MGDANLLFLGRLTITQDSVVDVVSNRSRCGNCKTGNNSQNGCECDCGNNRHEDCAANFESQERCRCVCSTRSIQDAVWTNQCCCAVAQDQGDQVESTDDADSPGNGATCFSRGRNGVETHQNVWQASGTKNQGQTQGNEVNLSRGGGAVLQPRLHNLRSFIAPVDDGLRFRVHCNCLIKQSDEAALDSNEDQDSHDDDTCN